MPGYVLLGDHKCAMAKAMSMLDDQKEIIRLQSELIELQEIQLTDLKEKVEKTITWLEGQREEKD